MVFLQWSAQPGPMFAIDLQIVKDSVNGEGTPSPGHAYVTGLTLEILEKQTPHQISLYNRPEAFVVTGPTHSLYDLVTSLRKIRAPTGLDRSKIPYSQRKRYFPSDS